MIRFKVRVRVRVTVRVPVRVVVAVTVRVRLCISFSRFELAARFSISALHSAANLRSRLDHFVSKGWVQVRFSLVSG